MAFDTQATRHGQPNKLHHQLGQMVTTSSSIPSTHRAAAAAANHSSSYRKGHQFVTWHTAIAATAVTTTTYPETSHLVHPGGRNTTRWPHTQHFCRHTTWDTHVKQPHPRTSHHHADNMVTSSSHGNQVENHNRQHPRTTRQQGRTFQQSTFKMQHPRLSIMSRNKSHPELSLARNKSQWSTSVSINLKVIKFLYIV